jgi:hypothetical protein
MPRAVVQLQTGRNHLDSINAQREPLSYMDVLLMVYTLHARTEPLFSDAEQGRYKQAVEKMRQTLAKARETSFRKTGGNQFREEFRARYQGKEVTYRIDIEVSGPLAP